MLIWAWAGCRSWRQALGTGYLAGVVFFSGLFWWLNNVELIAFLPLVIVQSAFMMGTAAVVFALREAEGVRWVAGVAGGWALFELIRLRAPVGGFPWGELGLTVDPTPLRAAAQWIGASGLSVVLVAIAATVIGTIERRVRPVAVAVLVGVVVVLVGAASIAPDTPRGELVTIAVVQGNSPCPGSSCPDERRIITQSHLELTAAIPADASIDLVIWPESSTGFATDPLVNDDVADAITTQARRLDAYVLVGGDRAAGDREFVNSNIVFSPDGGIAGEYLKTHPVPFGEYVPARPLFEWIPALDQVPRDMVRGVGPVTFELTDATLGSVISYEGAFSRYPRESVRAGAEIVVVATNQASFGDGPASDQFLAMSRMRAAELGTDVVHAAVTGKSAVLRADGSVDGPTGLFTSEVLTADVQARDGGLTLYALLGDWVQALSVVTALAVLVEPRVRRDRAVQGGAT